MTTIAFDGRFLAADSRASREMPAGDKCVYCDGESVRTNRDNAIKLYLGAGGVFNDERVLAVGGAGPASTLNYFSPLYAKHANLDKKLKDINEWIANRAVEAVHNGIWTSGSESSPFTEEMAARIAEILPPSPHRVNRPFTLLVITDQHAYVVNHHDLSDYTYDKIETTLGETKIAIGSGCKAAMVSMKVYNESAEVAVKNAGVVDIHTGGETKVIDIGAILENEKIKVASKVREPYAYVFKKVLA